MSIANIQDVNLDQSSFNPETQSERKTLCDYLSTIIAKSSVHRRRHMTDMATLNHGGLARHTLHVLCTRVYGSGNARGLEAIGLGVILLVTRVAVVRAVLLGVLALSHTGPRRSLTEPRKEVDVFNPDELAAHSKRAACQADDDEEPERDCLSISDCIARAKNQSLTQDKENPSEGFLHF